MTKIGASILVFLALFAFVGAEQFQTIDFDQGRLRFRSLATTTLKSFDTVNYTNMSAVNVNLGTEYTTRAAIDTTTTKTDMLILLSGSSTAFCSNCREFALFKCGDDNACKVDNSKTFQTIHPFWSVEKGHPFTLNVTIGADTTAWQLKSPALLYTASDKSHNTWSYPSSSSYYYIQDYTTYGFISMGIDGDSALNFVGDHPIFSINVTGSGTGKLIFGKDTTKIDTSKASQAITSTTNWTMPVANLSIGTYNTKASSSYPTTVVFDLNFPGLGIPASHYTSFITELMTKHGVVSDKSYNNSQYDYVYKGDLTKLPSIIFILSNGQNFTIHPQAYTSQLAEGVYNILLHSISTNYNSDTRSYDYYGVVGYSVMSHYYTLFEKTATGKPTITLYPNFAGAPSSNGSTTPTTTTTSSWKTILIVIVVVLVALVVLSLAFKKKNNLTKSDLGVELRAARV